MDASTVVPSPAELQARLRALSHAAVQELSRASGVPFTTLWNFRTGGKVGTNDPRLSTVRSILPHLPADERQQPARPRRSR